MGRGVWPQKVDGSRKNVAFTGSLMKHDEEVPVCTSEWVRPLSNIMKTCFLLSAEACNSSHAHIWVYFLKEWPENACLRNRLRQKTRVSQEKGWLLNFI